ncbi:hypothetical protein LC612_33590 [Nostoc sp. CHAB 5834]|nr:hypothetical protein [Nostoc sp. CHAB 5834]
MTTPNPQLPLAYQWIDAAYRLLEKNKGFVARPAQIELSKDVARAFLELTPLAEEAPTGTGKTLAYLLGAIATQATSALANPTPIVVSTGTKLLQQQLVTSDLPRLFDVGLFSAADVTLAKGKGNYLCLQNAHETFGVLEAAQQDPELFVDEFTSQMDYFELHALIDSFVSGKWNGDFDMYEGARPKVVFPIAVNSETCKRKKCEHYAQCAYYAARNKISTSKMVVGNHDLVLRDLASSDVEGEGGGLPLSNYLAVFDEAHHLPDKAIAVGSAEVSLFQVSQALPKITGLQRVIEGSSEFSKWLASKDFSLRGLDRVSLGESLKDLTDVLSAYDVDPDSGNRRFQRGVVPADVLAVLTPFGPKLDGAVAVLSDLARVLRENELPTHLEERANEVVRRVSELRRAFADAQSCVGMFCLSKFKAAKWFNRKEDSLSLHVSPLEGGEVLEKLLWSNPRAKGVAMVSATLQDVAGFSRFAQRSGLPPRATRKALPYTFPYGESSLVVAAMKATPKPAERREFYQELAVKLPGAIDETVGTLVLFPSWKMLKDFAPKLKSIFGNSAIKSQEDGPPKMLIKKHCADIDRGEGSILLGVASMAEGLDLPGKYCTHVCIVALPFAVPTSPVEEELAEILANKYFGQRSLPDATTRLTQMVGRLIRRESDRGKVTIFDRRLVTTSYGQQMLDSLPPFRRVVEKNMP